MGLDDASTDGQAHAYALGFGREECFEHLVEMLSINSCS